MSGDRATPAEPEEQIMETKPTERDFISPAPAAPADVAAAVKPAGSEPFEPTVGRAADTVDKPASAIPQEELERLTNDIIAALKTVYDPEIPADIYELGLIYKIDIDDIATSPST